MSCSAICPNSESTAICRNCTPLYLTIQHCTYNICTVKIKDSQIIFDWDNANISKSYFKHGVTPEETEEIFVDIELLVIPDTKHSLFELRFIAIGTTIEKKTLFVVFTLRRKKIRIISARRMHKREVEKYEKIRKKQNI